MLGLEVQNVKCDGCVVAIKNGLSEFEGLSIENIDIKSGNIEFKALGENSLAEVKLKLGELGYPAKS